MPLKCAGGDLHHFREAQNGAGLGCRNGGPGQTVEDHKQPNGSKGGDQQHPPGQSRHGASNDGAVLFDSLGQGAFPHLLADDFQVHIEAAPVELQRAQFADQPTRLAFAGHGPHQIQQLRHFLAGFAGAIVCGSEDVDDAGLPLLVEKDVARFQATVVTTLLQGVGHGLSDAVQQIHQMTLAEGFSCGCDVLEAAATRKFAGVEHVAANLCALVKWSDARMGNGGLEAFAGFEALDNIRPVNQLRPEQHQGNIALNTDLNGAVGFRLVFVRESFENLILPKLRAGGKAGWGSLRGGHQHLGGRVHFQAADGALDQLLGRVGSICQHWPAADAGLMAGEIKARGEQHPCAGEAAQRLVAQFKAPGLGLHHGLSNHKVQ